MVKMIRALTQPADISCAVQTLQKGGLVAFPTDTVYGVGAHAFVPEAVSKLYEAKIRPPDKAIPLLISDANLLPQVARNIPQAAYELATRFWPGALTLVLRRTPTVSDEITAGGDTVGVRVPDHPVAQALLGALGAPLAATSANLSGRMPAVDAEEVLAQLAGRIDLLLDGGICPGGVASTVLDLTVSPIRVLRAGPLLPALDKWL
ncbi:MAG: threonylcarbamoyl-AMP synthase [Anaerolineae bacterium]|nr:threonylcarbamoyl-AMP synthase [Anaerolineae bacterium]